VPPRRPALLASALERVLSDARLAEHLGRAGHRLIADSYSLSAVAAHYADLYEELAAPRVGRGRRRGDMSA
jgi:glycosyltransferase involved in cell wall biosynthesis